MKTTFMLIAITLYFSIICFSREKNKDNDSKKVDSLIIRYDARTGIASKYPTYEVHQDGYIRFEVNDINLFRYSVTLTELQNNVINSTKLSEGNTQINIDPMIFNLTDVNLNIQIIPVVPNKDTKELSRMGKVISDTEKEIKRRVTEMQIEAEKYSLAKGRIDEIEKIEMQFNKNALLIDSLSKLNLSKEQEVELEKLKNQNQILNSIILKKNIDTDIIKEYENKKNDLEKKLNVLNDTLANTNYRYNSKVLDDNTFNTRFDRFNSTLLEYKKSLTELNAITDMYQRLVSVLYSDQSIENIKSEKNKITRDFFTNDSVPVGEITRDDILKQSYIRLRNIDDKYTKFSEAYGHVSGIEEVKSNNEDNSNKSVSDIKDNAKEIFDKISAFHSQIKTTSFHSFFQQLAKVYDAINESNFTLKYQTLILTDNADLIHYSLKAEPHSNLPYSVETRPISFNYDVKINGGVKIDVSTGVFWNIGLDDNSYRFQSITADSTVVIKEESENLFIPSFGVLFNIYRRSNNNVKVGGNIGFSTNTEKLNYYMGASVLFGKSERLNLNLGFAGAQVKIASDLYNPDYPDNPVYPRKGFKIPIEDLPNEVPLRNPSPFKIGFYFGVSFNLLGTKNNETLSKISTM